MGRHPGDVRVVFDAFDGMTEVVFNGVHERQTQAFIGLNDRVPFRARGFDTGEVLVEIYD